MMTGFKLAKVNKSRITRNQQPFDSVSFAKLNALKVERTRYVVDGGFYDCSVTFYFDLLEGEEKEVEGTGLTDLIIEIDEILAQMAEKFVGRVVRKQLRGECGLMEFCWVFPSFLKECRERLECFEKLPSLDPFFSFPNDRLDVSTKGVFFKPPATAFTFTYIWKIELTEDGKVRHTRKLIPEASEKSLSFHLLQHYSLKVFLSSDGSEQDNVGEASSHVQ